MNLNLSEQSKKFTKQTTNMWLLAPKQFEVENIFGCSKTFRRALLVPLRAISVPGLNLIFSLVQLYLKPCKN